MLNKTVVRGDNTGNFGGGLFFINARFPEGMSVSKMDVQIGSKITKQYVNPIFPVLVNLTGEESLKLDFSSKVSVALWDNYGRKGTAPQTYELKSIAQLVNAPDTPITSDINNAPECYIPTLDFNCEVGSPIQAEFILDVVPSTTSALVNDSGFITNKVDDLVNYTKTADMNALLNLKANQTDLDQTNATVSNLSTTVTENYNTLNNKIDTVNQELTGDIDQLDTKIDNVEETLQGNINTLSDTVSSNYTTLEGQITAESTARNQAIANHNADETAHPFIQNLVTLEVTDRENAINDLQEQIDAQTASSDVKDVVGSYAQLNTYDTSKLGDNDIVKVLKDEREGNATTYYRWSAAENKFNIIGSVGPFATPGEVAEGYVPKTRQINGKSLSTDISLDAEDVGALPSSTVIPTKVSDLTNDLNFITNTNYATTSTGGVIKTALTAGNSVDSNGILQGSQRTQQQYATDSNVLMISKGTLENIKESLVTSIADTKYESKLDVQLLEGAVI